MILRKRRSVRSRRRALSRRRLNREKGQGENYGTKTSGRNPPNQPDQSLKMPPTPNVVTEAVTMQALLKLKSRQAMENDHCWQSYRRISLVSAGGVLSTCVFALGACAVNDAAMDQLQVALDAGSTDISWLTDMFGTVVLSMLGIQLVHEAAHRVIAWRDKVSTMPLDDCLSRRGFDSRIPT